MQRLQSRCGAEGARVVSGEERAGSKQTEFVSALCIDGNVEPLRALGKLSGRIKLFRCLARGGGRLCLTLRARFAPSDVIAKHLPAAFEGR